MKIESNYDAKEMIMRTYCLKGKEYLDRLELTFYITSTITHIRRAGVFYITNENIGIEEKIV